MFVCIEGGNEYQMSSPKDYKRVKGWRILGSYVNATLTLIRFELSMLMAEYSFFILISLKGWLFYGHFWILTFDSSFLIIHRV